MNVGEYVGLHMSGLRLSRATEQQFGVLAFDLGEVGPDPHPPPLVAQSSLDDRPSSGSPSGPWGVQVRQWRPALTLAEAGDGAYRLDKHGDLLVAEYGSPSKICSERWLLGGLSGYLRRYQRAHGRMPLSVSLFTLMTPCEKCNAYMRRFPGAAHLPLGAAEGGTIGVWNLWYTKDYIGYATPAEGDARTRELTNYGWRVTKG